MKHVSDVLREAMVEAEKRGVSLYRVAKECELDDSIVYRFYHDQCGLALSSVDRLAEFLHLELVPMQRRPARAGAAKKGNRKAKIAAAPTAGRATKKSKKSAKKKSASKKAKPKKARAR
jgi:hypothetical protein